MNSTASTMTVPPPANSIKTKKGISYVIGDSQDLENHILPINAIQYSERHQQLYSAGRDGTIKLWNRDGETGPETENGDNNVNQNINYYHSNDSVDDFQDIDEKILKLETSISSNPIPYKTSNSIFKNYSIVDNFNIYFDWINDLKLINNDCNLISCSSDLSIKSINLGDKSVYKFPNIHTDYIKKLSYFKNDNQLVSGALDGNVILWDLETTKPLRQIYNCSTSVEVPKSIYSLSNNDNLISTGGTSNAINLFDKRVETSHIRKLVGHQDNIRCLLMNDNFILSGSSDTSIKLWDLRSFKVYQNFDIHDLPVWSLRNEGNDFSIFYSGDKGGNIVKTDLSYLSYNRKCDYETFTSTDTALIDEKLGISVLVSQDDSPILSLCNDDSSLFSSNYTSMNRHFIPNVNQLSKYQYFRTCFDYLVEKEIQFNDEIASGLINDNSITTTTSQNNPNDDLNSDFYDLVSHLSMDTNLNDLQSVVVYDNDDEDVVESLDDIYNSMLLNINGGPSKEFVNTFKDIDNEYEQNENHKKTNENADLRINNTPIEILLNPIPENQINLIPFNIKPLNEFKITPKSIITKRIFNNKREMLVLYLNGDIKIWDILICKELQIFPYEYKVDTLKSEDLEKRLKHMDTIFQKYETSDTLNNWCEVEVKAGKLFITIKETSFMNVEVYYDELIRSYPFLSLDHPDNSKLKKLGKVLVSNDDRFYIGSVLLNSLFHPYTSYEYDFDIQLREELRNLKKNNRTIENLPDDDTSSISSGIRKLKYFGKKQRDGNERLNSYNPTPSNSTSTSINEIEDKGPLSEFFNFKESRTYEYDNSIMKLLQGNKKFYWDKYNSVPKNKLVDSIMKVDTINPKLRDTIAEEIQYIPLIDLSKFPQNLLIIIFEHSPDLGNYRDVFSFQLSDIINLNSNNIVNEFRFQLPRWIGQPILYNKWPVKESPKIAFQLFECDYGILPPNKKIGGKVQKKIKKLPLLESSIKLTSHNMLRVSKILFYLTEKFESKTSEMKDKKLSPPDWLVLNCKGEELSNNMTLQTIKTKIWKNNSDIELTFRRKFDN